MPINLGVVIREFPDPEHEQVAPEAGHPYFVCERMFIAAVSLVMKRFPPEERVVVIFDRQDQFDAHAETVFHEMMDERFEGSERFTSIQFDGKENHLPLQAADALAFDSYQEFLRRRDHPNQKPRPSYEVLTKNPVIKPEWVLDLESAHQWIRNSLSQ
jgi:hypothetical protein